MTTGLPPVTPFPRPYPDLRIVKGCKDKSLWTFPDADGKQLLPGLPNEIILAHVVPKLEWIDFYFIALVSPAWCHAIRSRQVYDAKVASLSTETLIVFSYQPYYIATTLVALYSKTYGDCFVLPPVPMCDGNFPETVKCAALDGKIYVWGLDDECSDRDRSYVFDLAGQKRWRKFGRREQLRDTFAFECAALDGKIYTFGGLGENDPIYGSEVYDPAANTYAPIKPMRSLRYDHRVAAIGGELFVYGGKTLDIHGPFDDSLMIYHPGRDEWRVVEDFGSKLQQEFTECDRDGAVFLALGKLHSLSQSGIHVYDAGSNLWTFLQSCSWARVLVGPAVTVSFDVVVAVDDMLFAIVHCRYNGGERGVLFVQCEGLGSENKTLEWVVPKRPSYIVSAPLVPQESFMCTVEL